MITTGTRIRTRKMTKGRDYVITRHPAFIRRLDDGRTVLGLGPAYPDRGRATGPLLARVKWATTSEYGSRSCIVLAVEWRRNARGEPRRRWQPTHIDTDGAYVVLPSA